MKTSILLGHSLDGAVWSKEKAELGKLKLGTGGFLSFLEGKLGLGGMSVPESERVALYRKKYQNWLKTEPGAGKIFAAESFKTDSWSTAKQLLQWRDELIEGLWSPKEGGGARIALLAALESNEPKLPAGAADRLRAVLAALKDSDSVGDFNFEVQLHEPKELFKPIWRRVFAELVKRGVAVSEPEPIPSRLAELDVTVVEGNTEFELAVQTARYLSAGSDADNANVTLLCEGDTRLLDGILHRYGIGAVGNKTASVSRPSHVLLQILNELSWEPFRPNFWLDLLLHPLTPIPGSVKWHLIQALKKEPGIGEEWDRAWLEGEEARKDETEEERGKRAARLRKLRKMFETRYNSETGIPADELAERCDLIREILNRKGNSGQNQYPGIEIAVSRIKAFRDLAVGCGQGKLTRVDLVRILDVALGEGTEPDDLCREAVPFTVVTKPGMITDETETLLWYNFVQPNKRNETHWSKSELEYLIGNGAEIETNLARRLENWNWASALGHTGKRVICFQPGLIAGEEAFTHPYLFDIAAAKREGEEKISTEKLAVDQGDLIHTSEDGMTAEWRLADRSLILKKEEEWTAGGLPGLEDGFFTLSSGRSVERETGKAISFSEVNNLLNCPFKWFVESYLGIGDEFPPEIPTGGWLCGNLAHKIFEKIAVNSSFTDWEAAGRDAGVYFDELVPKMAAMLNCPEYKVERGNIRERIIDAARVLAKNFQKWGVVKLNSEQSLESQRRLAGYPINGRLDLAAVDSNDCCHIVDYKWSWGDKYLKHEDKCHLQLAFYAKLVADSFSEIDTRFYLVPRVRFSLGDPKTLQEIWDEAEEKLLACLNDLKNGTVRFAEIEKEGKIPSVCEYCPMKQICCKNEGSR